LKKRTKKNAKKLYKRYKKGAERLNLIGIPKESARSGSAGGLGAARPQETNGPTGCTPQKSISACKVRY